MMGKKIFMTQNEPSNIETMARNIIHFHKLARYFASLNSICLGRQIGDSFMWAFQNFNIQKELNLFENCVTAFNAPSSNATIVI